jgi:predicted nucleotidyltransferase
MKQEHDVSKYQFIAQLKKLPFVEKVILFGSRARGTQQDRSDIDLAVVCPTATQTQWHEILEIINQADTLLRIDCVRFDTLDDSDTFKQRILKDGVVL